MRPPAAERGLDRSCSGLGDNFISTLGAEDHELTGALRSIIQRSADESHIEALEVRLQEVEQGTMMRTYQGERRLRAKFHLMCLGISSKFKRKSFYFPKVVSAHGSFPKLLATSKKLISYFLQVACKLTKVETVTFCKLTK